MNVTCIKSRLNSNAIFHVSTVNVMSMLAYFIEISVLHKLYGFDIPVTNTFSVSSSLP